LATTIVVRNIGRKYASARESPIRNNRKVVGAPLVSVALFDPQITQNATTTPTFCQVNPCTQRARNRVAVFGNIRCFDAVVLGAGARAATGDASMYDMKTLLHPQMLG
jgi:hypothetical protein